MKQRQEGVIQPNAIPLNESEISEEDFPKLDRKVCGNTCKPKLLLIKTKPEDIGELPPPDKTAILGPEGQKLRQAKRKLVFSRLDEDRDLGPRVQDIVVLPEVQELNLVEIVKDIFRPRRKLNPHRKERQVHFYKFLHKYLHQQ